MPQRSAPRPQAIRTDGSNPFARRTMSVRLPGIVEEIVRGNADYPGSIRLSLEALSRELDRDAPLRAAVPPAPDCDAWVSSFEPHRGSSWLSAEWFFAEHLFYRRIIEAVRWWETGRDPFRPAKEEAYRDPALRGLVEEALEGRVRAGERRDSAERLARLLLRSLWGNRADLSHRRASALGTGPGELLADDRERAIDALLASRGPVHLVTDNAGPELAMDLVLADSLLASGTGALFLHVKLHPAFVSDATAPDVLSLVARLVSGGFGDAGTALASRLEAAFSEARLRIAPDLFWNSPSWLSALPPRIGSLLASGELVILKGDVNYRRLVGDALWRPETPLAQAAALWGRHPPILCLRALKSDAVAGLPPGAAERLDATSPDWRTDGSRGVAQLLAP